MRLIDADKLYDDIARYRDENMLGGGNLLVDDILEDINLSPTVDAEPVRHGKWIFNSERYSWECSECQRQTGSIFEESKSKFCKNCGCRMDGE